MRYILLAVGLFLALAALGDAAVVQRRYRNAQEILVPVTVIQDGEVFPEIQKISSEIKTVVEDVPQTVEEEQKSLEVTEAAEIAVEAHRRIDDDILEEDIKEVVEEENKELLKALKEKEEQLDEAKEEVLKQEEPAQELKKTVTEEFVLLSDLVPELEDATKKEEPVDQIKSLLDKENAEEIVLPLATGDVKEEETDGSLRQATQATPSQTTTQQSFVQQLIQNSPLGQFFNQISGQTTQSNIANDEVAATPAPTIPGFLAPAINAAQSVVNSTTSALQGLQQFASNLGTQFQSTLSGLGGQQPAQQSVGDATTARPAGPLQQLVNTFMGNNNQQATPAPQQQGPLQGLLNIFQGNNNNNNNNNKPQVNDATANIVQPDPAKQPEAIEQTNDAETELESQNTVDEISNDIRSSAESEDSFEDAVHPEEMIVVQDDATQTLSDSDKV